MRSILLPPATAPAWRPGITLSSETALHWILRVAVTWCFVGHGAFGVWHGGKVEWLVYFHVVGLPDWLAWRLMPLIGMFDISVGLLTLFYPLRAALVWAVFWTTWTALLRPLAGQGWSEFFERAGNYGVPLALLYLSGLPRTRRALVGQALPWQLDSPHEARLAWILRLTTALLLIGHGGFGAFIHKSAWIGYLGALGIGADTVRSLSLVSVVGWFEIALGLAVLAWPVAPLLLFVFAWKVGTESLRLVVGEPIFEFVERGGSYGAPLALCLVTWWSARPVPTRPDDGVAALDGVAVPPEDLTLLLWPPSAVSRDQLIAASIGSSGKEGVLSWLSAADRSPARTKVALEDAQ